jgi:ParB family chromosome partitioning protein
LLDRLVASKLERAAKTLEKEGWKRVERHADFGHEQKGQFRRIYPEQAPLPPKQASEYAALEQELETLRTQWNEVDDDSEEPARIGEIEERLEKIDAKRGHDVWTAEQLAIAGAVVTISYDGKTEILRGLVKPEDMPKKKPAPKAAPEAGAEESQFPALSAALVESLTAHRSAALAAELQQRPDIALAAVVHGFAARILFGVTAQDSAFQVTASGQSLQLVEGSKAFVQMEAAREDWRRSLPATVEELWLWCLAQKQEVLLKLLAVCLAATLNAVRGKGDRPDCARLQHAEMLAAALSLDMKAWFTPDAEKYLSRISKPQIFADLQEARGQPPAPAWGKLKKADLAKEAERQVAGKGWLPALLRPAA